MSIGRHHHTQGGPMEKKLLRPLSPEEKHNEKIELLRWKLDAAMDIVAAIDAELARLGMRRHDASKKVAKYQAKLANRIMKGAEVSQTLIDNVPEEDSDLFCLTEDGAAGQGIAQAAEAHDAQLR